MFHRKYIIPIAITSMFFIACNAQEKTQSMGKVGGQCEDCEAALDYKLLDLALTSTAQMPGAEKLKPEIIIEGIVFEKDGKTPASDVVLYFYQTNKEGLYKQSDKPFGWEQRHGKFRTWAKTNKDGTYALHTFRPGAYPSGQEAEHIHLYIVEKNKSPYYIDNFIFQDDPKLSKSELDQQKERGGSGLIKFEEINGTLMAKRNIILGLNIPNYK
ncbi:MAG: intradiol ring-cleavage dioxygenase [Bacteroidota bacterium]